MLSVCEEYIESLEFDLKQLKEHTYEIVLYGTVDMSELVLLAMQKMQIANRHIFYVDGNKSRQGQMLHGKKIYSPDKLLEPVERDVIICSYNEDTCKQICGRFAENEHLHFFSADALWLWYQIAVRKRNTSLACLGKVLYTLRHPQNQSIVFESVDVIITERCTLRCRDCIQMIPYFKKPVNYDTDVIRQSVKAFSEIVDAVKYVRIIGGEPFLHPEIVNIAKACIKDNFLLIGITTNGTIVPKDEVLEQLAKLPVHISISDYGEHSRKISELTKKCEEYEIGYTVLGQSYNWYHVNYPVKHNRTEKENNEIFASCKSKENQSILGGKLYRCNYSGAIEPFGIIENAGYDLLSEETLERKKEAMTVFENACKCLNACDYCKVWEEIPVGIGVQWCGANNYMEVCNYCGFDCTKSVPRGEQL